MSANALCEAWIVIAVIVAGAGSESQALYCLRSKPVLASPRAVGLLSLLHCCRGRELRLKGFIGVEVIILKRSISSSFFFFNPLQEPRLSAVPKWNSALGTYEEGSRQELLIVSKNNSKRQANGNDWVLALYGYSNHFYIFWFPPLMLNYLHVGIMMVYHWKY